MKKTVSLLIALLLLCGSLVLPAFADMERTAVTCQTSASTCKRGDTITVNVSISGADPIKGMTLTPNYDKDVFTLLSNQWTVPDAFMKQEIDDEYSDAMVLYKENTDLNGPVFSMELQVKDTAAFAEAIISADASIAWSDGAGNEPKVTVTGQITSVTIVCAHQFGTSWKSDASGHWHACDVCGEKADTASHTYDNNCDTNCNICGYTREITHSYAEDWSFDAKEHWHACTVCGDKGDVAAHELVESAEETYLKSAANCSSPAVYYKHCSTCGAVSEETFTSGEVNADVHAHTERRDAVEKTCTTDGFTGDLYCTDCGQKLEAGTTIPAGHTLKKVEAKDPTHKEDGNQEYYLCEACKKLFAEESAETELDAADVVLEKLPHVYGDTYKSDTTNHWKECECGEIAEKAAHTFGDWTVTKAATATEAGSRTRTCTVCEYVETEEIPVVGAAGTDSEAEPEKTPAEGESGAIFAWLAVFAASLGGLLFLGVSKRRRTH